MLRRTSIHRPQQVFTAATMLLAVMISAAPFQTAFALITGGEGNRPLRDPGWPKGAAAIFNNPARIAWWEGPPFGGGQYHAECRGDTKAFNAVMADFAKLDAKTKRVIVHDGVGHSFWLDPNRKPEKRSAAKMDWSFMVWVPANWERLSKMPADLNPTDPDDANQGAPAEIEVYTGGSIRWSDVKIPKGIEVIDKRLEAHGFTPADGVVLEGKVIDLATERPVAATIQLQHTKPLPEGGDDYSVVSETVADEQGRWVLKNAPPGRHRVVVKADGYVPRLVGHVGSDEQPRWHSYDCGLSRPGPISGHVTDGASKPLADVDVRLGNVVSGEDGRYQSPREYSTKTDANGGFRLDNVPIGSATIRLIKPGYCRPGLGQPITTPTGDVALQMIKSAQVTVTVFFPGTDRPRSYIVHMEPEGGSAVGKWGGSGRIDANNKMVFNNVPPGRYVLHGRPNPSSRNQETERITIELEGGKTTAIALPAK